MRRAERDQRRGRDARKVRKVRTDGAVGAATKVSDVGLQRTATVVVSGERRLWLAIGVSLLVHAVALSLQFKFPEASRVFQDKALDIILVNSKSARKPDKAQALAQTNLDGGGNTDQDRRVKTPLPPSAKQQKGEELEKAEKRVQALEARQKKLLAAARSKEVVVPSSRTETEVQPEPTPAPMPSGRDLASSALEMMRLEGQVARQTDEYNKRPRKKFFGARTEEYRFARYIEDWRLKVERVGTLNYPAAAKGKLYGSLVLSVIIKADGTVGSMEISRSSGHKVLDDAALRIVSLAGPFSAFPPEIRRDTDLIEISRTWNFTRGNSLETNNKN